MTPTVRPQCNICRRSNPAFVVRQQNKSVEEEKVTVGSTRIGRELDVTMENLMVDHRCR